MPDAPSGSVLLLQADPELVRGLDQRRAREAAQRLYARAIELPRGRGTDAKTVNGGSRPIGVLVLSGLLVREASVGDHPSAELRGPGDLLRSWDDAENEVLLPRSVEWTALTATRLAIIDQAFTVRAAQWPEVFASLIERASRRAERLVVMQAIAHLTRVDDRLLALMWCLAERWGRVAPGGGLGSLRLSHPPPGGMVGARRPSVTTALGQLMARGEVERRPDGEWILRGDPPQAQSGSQSGAHSVFEDRPGARRSAASERRRAGPARSTAMAAGGMVMRRPGIQGPETARRRKGEPPWTGRR